MKDSTITVDFISDIQLLNEEEFYVFNIELPSLRFGYGNTFKQLQLPIIYNESQMYQKILTFQVDDVYLDHNYIEINAGRMLSTVKLFYYEDSLGVITITKEFRSDNTLCSDIGCMAEKYNKNKIAAEGGDVVYVMSPHGYPSIDDIG